MTLKPIVHEIRIQNQVIFLDPPIEYARSTWIRQLHDWLGTCHHQPSESCFHLTFGSFRLGVVCRLRRIQSSRYEIGLQMQGATVTETTYTSLVCHYL
jgi:dynein heavy chain 1